MTNKKYFDLNPRPASAMKQEKTIVESLPLMSSELLVYMHVKCSRVHRTCWHTWLALGSILLLFDMWVNTLGIAFLRALLSYSPFCLFQSLLLLRLLSSDPHLLIIYLDCNLISSYLYVLSFCPSTILQLALSLWWAPAPMSWVICCPEAWKPELGWEFLKGASS